MAEEGVRPEEPRGVKAERWLSATVKIFRVPAVVPGRSPEELNICVRIRDSIQDIRTIGNVCLIWSRSTAERAER